MTDDEYRTRLRDWLTDHLVPALVVTLEHTGGMRGPALDRVLVDLCIEASSNTDQYERLRTFIRRAL